MKTRRPRRVRALALLLAGLAFSASGLRAQSILLSSAKATNQSVAFQVQGPAGAYIRVDSSPDLLHWLPVDLYYNASSGASHTTTDMLSPTNSAQFYMAHAVAPDVEVLGLSPASGAPGKLVTVIGQFYPPAGQFTVEIGGQPARVVSESSTRLVVTVPANGTSGRVTVGATNGEATGEGVFVSLSNAIAHFQPPAGLAVGNFGVADNYGAGVLVSNTVSDYSLPVRAGLPTMIFASGLGAQSNLFFSAVAFGPGGTVLLNATSTAQMLVFQNPNLFTGDLALAESVMGLIATNAAVLNFGQVLATDMMQSANPFEDAAVTNAYEDAVVSVLSSDGFHALEILHAQSDAPAQHVPNPTPQDAGAGAAQIYQIENPLTRFIEVKNQALKVSVSAEDFFFNPVDWLVSFQQIDVDAAFPNGVNDFNPIQQHWETSPRLYPGKGQFMAERSVAANLVSSRLNVVTTASKWLVDAIASPIPSQTLNNALDDAVTLPPGNGMYLVRAVGPSFVPPEDFNFVNDNMADLYVRAVAINLAAAALDIASAVVDDSIKDQFGNASKLTALASKAVQLAPGIHTSDDFVRVAYSICSDLVKDFTSDLMAEGMNEALKMVAENTVSINKKLAKVSSVGQVAERASGLFRTTSLETTFVKVGDPFALQNVAANPGKASPGATVTVTFKGSAAMHPFDTNNSADKVSFYGDIYFDGQVTSVSGPDGSGVQTLTVQIPVSLGSTHDGAYTMYVVTQGRTGSTNFTLSTDAALQVVRPLNGFAPAANFQGQPYRGTSVRLQGALFTWTDTFLFSGVAATNVQPNDFEGGDVTVTVPPGAVTGPIKILHKINDGSTLTITGPVFTVWGPPVINSVKPPGGAPITSVVIMDVSQAGTDPTLVYAQFSAAYAEAVNMLPNGSIYCPIPNNAKPGSLTVITPAGSNSVPYEVYAAPVATNPPVGATIYVNHESGVSLAEAIAFANGSSVPSYDQASNCLSTFYANSSPADWELGPGWADTITVDTNSESVNFNFKSGTVYGVFLGNLVISGNNNIFSGTFTGSINITGTGNRFYGNYSGPVTVTGASNFIVGGNFTGPIQVLGTNDTLGSGGFMTCQAPVTILGDNTVFNYTTFQFVNGDGLTIRGNGCTGTINCLSNSGTGLVIDGGNFNVLTVNSATGNGGNGVTVTGGAEGNYLAVGTGGYSSQQGFGVPGTGNLGHGLALLDSAVDNAITTLGPSLSGNALDGLYLDGAGVIFNNVTGNFTYNGRNGVTITNGAAFNNIGSIDLDNSFYSVDVISDYNAGSGVVCADCGVNVVDVLAQSNGLYGFVASNVRVAPETFYVAVASDTLGSAGQPLHIAGNGAGGVRLEKGSTGFNIYGTLESDPEGVEVDGGSTSSNEIMATIYGASGNGVVATNGTHDNIFTVGVSHSGADGILIDHASNNVFQVFASVENRQNGVHLTGDAAGNTVTAGPIFSYYGNNVSEDVVSNLADGCLVDNGAHDNLVSSLAFALNAMDGVGFSGIGTTNNQAIGSFMCANLRDGVRFEQGAGTNTLGAEALDTNLPPDTTISFNGEAGVCITDAGTAGNLAQNCSIGGLVCVHNQCGSGQPIGVLAENGADIGQITASFIVNNTNGVILRAGANNGVFNNLTFSLNTNVAVQISNAFNIVVGGPSAGDHNEIADSQIGIDVSGPAATNNQIVNTHITRSMDAVSIRNGAARNEVLSRNIFDFNIRGVHCSNASGNVVIDSAMRSNDFEGVRIEMGSASNLISGDTIVSNGVGVLVADPGSVGNTITGNSISGNSFLGIALANGGNNLVSAPTLVSYNSKTLQGTNDAPDGSVVEIFADPGAQGLVYLGAGIVVNGQFSVELQEDPFTNGLDLNLNGTVTDTSGNTSQFSSLPPPEFPPQGNLVYASSSRIYLWVDANASIDLSKAGDSDSQPSLAVAPGCSKIVFTRFDVHGGNIFVMNAVSNAQPQAVTTDGTDSNPAWLLPCQTVVFESFRSGNGKAQIYAADVSGANVQMLTTNITANNTSPAPAQDGTQIVFISDRTGSNALWIMAADGSNQRFLAGVPGAPNHPALSPDGLTVALDVTLAGGASEIALVNTDGSGYLQLTADGAHAAHPTWTPDGLSLVFSSDRSHSSIGLYSMDRSGANIERLLTTPNVFDAEWPSVGAP